MDDPLQLMHEVVCSTMVALPIPTWDLESSTSNLAIWWLTSIFSKMVAPSFVTVTSCGKARVSDQQRSQFLPLPSSARQCPAVPSPRQGPPPSCPSLEVPSSFLPWWDWLRAGYTVWVIPSGCDSWRPPAFCRFDVRHAQRCAWLGQTSSLLLGEFCSIWRGQSYWWSLFCNLRRGPGRVRNCLGRKNVRLAKTATRTSRLWLLWSCKNSALGNSIRRTMNSYLCTTRKALPSLPAIKNRRLIAHQDSDLKLTRVDHTISQTGCRSNWQRFRFGIS